MKEECKNIKKLNEKGCIGILIKILIIHIHLNHRKQPVHHKEDVKKEIVQVPQIKTFTPLHQMTNYVPIPGMPIHKLVK